MIDCFIHPKKTERLKSIQRPLVKFTLPLFHLSFSLSCRSALPRLSHFMSLQIEISHAIQNAE